MHIFKVDYFLTAFWSLAAIIGIGVFYKESKMRIPDIMETLELGTKNALAIGAACACIGFIVGATTLTGLGLKFAAAIIELAKGVAGLVMSLDFLHLMSGDATAFPFPTRSWIRSGNWPMTYRWRSIGDKLVRIMLFPRRL